VSNYFQFRYPRFRASDILAEIPSRHTVYSNTVARAMPRLAINILHFPSGKSPSIPRSLTAQASKAALISLLCCNK